MPDDNLLTSSQREEVVQFIRSKLEQQGACPCNNIPNFMKRRAMPSWQSGRIPNEKLYEWVRRTFPEFDVELDKAKNDHYIYPRGSRPVPAPKPVSQKHLTAELRSAAVSEIERQISANGFCWVTHLTNVIPDWKEYAGFGENFPGLVARLFPEYTHKSYNGAAAVFHREEPPLPYTLRSMILADIQEQFNSQGFCWTAALTSAFPTWRKYVMPGENFPELLERLFPEFDHRIHNNAAAIFPKGTEVTDQISTTAVTRTEINNTVFRLLYLQSNSALTASVRELTGNPTLKQDEWRSSLIDALWENLMGLRQDFLDDSAGDDPKLAVPMLLGGEKRIYAVLVRNTSVERQYWKLGGFAVPGLEDENGWGRWLCTAFHLPSEDQEAFLAACGQVDSCLQELEDLRVTLSEQLSAASRTVQAGCPTEAGLAETVRRWEQGWDALRTAMENAMLPQPEDPMSLDQISLLSASLISAPVQLADASDTFARLAENTWNYLSDQGLIFTKAGSLAEDLAEWERLSTAGGSLRESTSPLLSAYRAVQYLTQREESQDETERQAAAKILNAHFGTNLVRNREILTYFSYAAEDDAQVFAFLEDLEHLDRLITLVETASDESGRIRTVTPEACAARKSGLPLLQAIINGENTLGSILTGFPLPDELEQAVMAGNVKRARVLLEEAEETEETRHFLNTLSELDRFGSNQTPNLSGQRLLSVLGNRNHQAARCFLLALSLKMTEAAEGLSRIYLEEGRTEELELLLRTCSSGIEPETLNRILFALLEAGRISAQEIAEEHLDAVLNWDRLEQIREKAPEFAGLLENVLRRMDAPFVRYVVFRSDELRSYVLEAENIEEIHRLGISKSGPELLELLRTENYDLGSTVISTARRVYTFMGNWNGLVSALLSLAPDGLECCTMRFRLAKDAGDKAAMLALLQENQKLKERYITVYRDLLFERGDYPAYLESNPDDDPVRVTIAQISCGSWDGTLPDLSAVEPEALLLLRTHLSGECLGTLSAAAEGQGDLFLAYYLAPEPDEELTARTEAALDAAFQAHCPPEQSARMLRRLEFLCGPLCRERQEEMLPVRYRAALDALDSDEPGTGGEAALTLLKSVSDAETLSQLLTITAESGKGSVLCEMPGFLGTLETLCDQLNLGNELLALLHECRNISCSLLSRSLLARYRNALEQNCFPEQLTEAAEIFALDCYQLSGNPDAAVCVYLLEVRRNRPIYRSFAMLAITSRMEDFPPETAALFRSGQDGEAEEELPTELSLFSDLLADPESSLPDYLSFCQAFNLTTPEDETAAFRLNRPYASKSESVAILHVLYRDCKSPSAWITALKLPLRDRPERYARLLLEAAEFATPSVDADFSDTSLWKQAADYCMEAEAFSPLLTVLSHWAAFLLDRYPDAFPWYMARGLFAILEQLGACFPPAWNDRMEEVRTLMERTIQIFNRFNSSDVGDANHNSLRTIVEFSVASGLEELVLGSSVLMSSLNGPNRKLCFVLALRLLQTGEDERMERANNLLQHLNLFGNDLPYLWLIHKLVKSDPETQKRWCASPVGRDLIRLILPDGNQVNGAKLRELVMLHIDNNTYEDGIRTAEALLQGGDDLMVYTALFILCKENPGAHLPQLYRALSVLCLRYPTDQKNGMDQTRNFTRTRDEMINLLIIVRVVMEKQGAGDLLTKADQDFNGTLRAIYDRCGALRAQISVQGFIRAKMDYRDKIDRLYSGRSPELVTAGLMGVVSGNWLPFLCMAHTLPPQSAHPLFALACAKGVPAQTDGLKRSIYRMLKGLPTTKERSELLDWLKQCSGCTPKLSRLYQIVQEISHTDPKDPLFPFYDLERVDERFFTLPTDEIFLCLGDWSDLEREDQVSCFHWIRRHTPVSNLRPTINLFIRMARDKSTGVNVVRHARHLFTHGSDEQAFAYYNVLNFSSRSANPQYQVFGKYTNQCTEQDKRFWQEHFQCRMRICGAFTGDERILAKLRGTELNPRTAYNLVITLLSSSRAGEVHRLAHLLRGENRKLALALLKLVSPEIKDSEKLAIRESFRGNLQSYEAITYLLSRTTKTVPLFQTSGRPAEAMRMAPEAPMFLLELSTAKELERQYQILVGTHQGKTVPFYLCPESQLSAAQLIQQEPAPAEDAMDPAEPVEAEAYAEHPLTLDKSTNAPEPAFVKELQQQFDGQLSPDAQELEEAYQNTSFSAYRDRMTLSGKLYLLVRANPDANEQRRTDALIRSGLDYYRCCWSENSEESRARAIQAIRELSVACSGRSIRNEALQNLTEEVPFALQRILNGFTNADELAEDCRLHRESYAAMVRLSENRYSFLPNVFNALNTLNRSCAGIGDKKGNEERYKAAYHQCASQLSELPRQIAPGISSGWPDVLNHLVTLMQEAMNQVDCRADLSLTVLNEGGCGMCKDFIFGELWNSGREEAREIEVFMSWWNESEPDYVRTSPKYHYSSLKPEEVIAFALEYEADERFSSLSYRITVTAAGSAGRLDILPTEGTLHITPNKRASYPVNLYDCTNPPKFEVKDGAVTSDSFFGRDSQCAELRGCVSGDVFQNYQNRVVQGIRRSGKTTLLEYLRAYCAAEHPELVVRYQDCQGVTEQVVQTVFIASLLAELPRKIPSLRDIADWQNFCEKWTLETGSPDRRQQDLSPFYTDLSGLLSALEDESGIRCQGILLILDEFDVLLQKLERRDADDLLRTLRSVMTDRSNLIRMVFCGSNNLIRYRTNGGIFNQFFHSVETTVVDDLPPEDLANMLRTPYRKLAQETPDDGSAPIQVVIPDSTMRWVYRYTGGLVWYTKLLGSAMLRQARSAGRTVVYPTDVCAAFAEICTDGNCLQFREGCGDEEDLVLRAMAELSSRYLSRVTIAALRSQLGDRLSDLKLNAALTRLKELRLLESDGFRFRFRKEIYRRYFRAKLTVPGNIGDILEQESDPDADDPFGDFQ